MIIILLPESKRPNYDFAVGGVYDIASSLAEFPFQPILNDYPKRKYGSRERSFLKDWCHNSVGWNSLKKNMPYSVIIVGPSQSRAEMISGRRLDPETGRLSKNHWCCQAEAWDAVVAILGAIKQSIEHFAEDSGNVDRRTAAQHIIGFMDTDFVVCLCIFQRLLTKHAIVSNYLQSKDLDIARGVELVKALKVDLIRNGFLTKCGKNQRS